MSKRMLVLVGGLAVAIGVVTPQPAAAGLILDGKIVNYQYYFPNLSSPYAAADNGDKLVGPGIEVNDFVDGRGTMDISDTNLYMDFTSTSSFNPAAFNGFVLTDTFGTIPAFTMVTINAVTNLVGLDASRVSWDTDHIRVNFESLPFDADTVVSLDIEAVPEPASLLLLGAGLVGLAARRRRAS